MTHAMVVRLAGAGEVPLAAPLFDAYRQFYGEPSDLDGARVFLEARITADESLVLLAYSVPAGSGDGGSALPGDMAPVGFTQIYPSFSSLALRRILVLHDLFVSPTHRRHGVARRLVDAARVHATRVGAVRLDLATQHGNVAALRLYESIGFVPETGFTHLVLDLHAEWRAASLAP